MTRKVVTEKTSDRPASNGLAAACIGAGGVAKAVTTSGSAVAGEDQLTVSV